MIYSDNVTLKANVKYQSALHSVYSANCRRISGRRFFPFAGREATTGNTSAVRRLHSVTLLRLAIRERSFYGGRGKKYITTRTPLPGPKMVSGPPFFESAILFWPPPPIILWWRLGTWCNTTSYTIYKLTLTISIVRWKCIWGKIIHRRRAVVLLSSQPYAAGEKVKLCKLTKIRDCSQSKSFTKAGCERFFVSNSHRI